MLMVPSGLIIISRRRGFEKHGDVNHVHKSLFKHKTWPIVILIISFILFIYSGYVNIDKTF